MKLDRLFDSFLGSGKDDSKPRGNMLFWVSILLAGLFLYLALRDVEWTEFVSQFKRAQIAYLPLVLLWGSLTSLIRAYRWRILLNSERPVSVARVFLANMAGYLGNMVLPARAGELVRAAYLARQTSIPMSFAIATGLTERLMDVVALVLLGSLSLFWTGLLSSSLEGSLQAMGLIGVTGLIAILFLPRFANLIGMLVDRLPGLHTNQKTKIHSVIRNFMLGLASLSTIGRATSFTGLTAVIWIMDAAGMVFLSYALSLSLTFSQAFVLLAALGLSSAIPSTPGYVGVYQFAAVWALKPFGFSSVNAIALALFAQAMNLLITGIWGWVAMASYSRFSPISTAE